MGRKTWRLDVLLPDDVAWRSGTVCEGPVRVIWGPDGKGHLFPWEVVHPVRFDDGQEARLSDLCIWVDGGQHPDTHLPWVPVEGHGDLNLVSAPVAQLVYDDIRARYLPAGERVTVSDGTGRRPAVVLADPARIDWALDETGYEMPQVIHQAVRVDGADSATWVPVEQLHRLEG
ncbi:hypothetical protein [Prescottella agglutinans]|uniref:Uncharacterized protein n=1 Tax=Prescottella agglutinans TaxID=1644129 RepID=A0ABT6MJV6_9NOCA|nr:hypothetical protein [Prescottella agglutinans]MDH6284597.1 hypothetical protein [Prescottella agglutinans]